LYRVGENRWRPCANLPAAIGDFAHPTMLDLNDPTRQRRPRKEAMSAVFFPLGADDCDAAASFTLPF
jgi:hypothetical protein